MFQTILCGQSTRCRQCGSSNRADFGGFRRHRARTRALFPETNRRSISVGSQPRNRPHRRCTRHLILRNMFVMSFGPCHPYIVHRIPRLLEAVNVIAVRHVTSGER
jgi:hypothetical protein